MDVAEQKGFKPIAEVLQQRGAKYSSGSSFHLAAKNGDIVSIEEMLDKGHDINEVDAGKGWTALHYAVNYGQKHLVEYLIIKDADVNKKDFLGKNNPIDVLSNTNRGEIVDTKYKEFTEVKIPHRRPSIFKSLPHEQNGFLGTKVQKLSNRIHQLTLRGGANFIVTSPTVATVLESIPGFASTNNGEADQMEYAFGVQKMGSLNGRYKVYKNPYMTENLMLMD